MRKEVKVVGAIIVQDEKILCAQRGPGRSLANYWEFPGGKIEQGESPRQALLRELDEELKIKVSVSQSAFDTTVYDYDFARVHLTTFVCELETGVPTLTEHVAIKWLPAHSLDQLEWAPADRPAVKKLMHKSL